MEWAEAAGLGELGLMPDDFWSLTVHEFNLKWAAFGRLEDRRKALVTRLARMTAHCSEKRHAEMMRSENALRRYPLKRWLLPPSEQ